MAPLRRFPSRGMTVSQRRKTSWTVGPSGELNPSAVGASLFGVAAEAQLEALTIVRTRGELLIYTAVAGTALEGMQGAFGICVVSQNAAGVGVTAVPHPVTDVGWDGWLYHRTWNVFSPTGSIGDGSGAEGVRIEIDSKAMRKTKITDNVIAVIEVATLTGTYTIEAKFRSRILVKLP